MKKIYVCLTLILAIFASCDNDFDYSPDGGNSSGTGGSLARFTIALDHLYTVDQYNMKVYSLSDDSSPELVNSTYIGFGIETIFSKGNLLFIGSNTGVHIFSVENPVEPKKLSTFEHVFSCDPVVVSGNYAYSTLNSSGACGRGLNQLDIVNVANPGNPVLVKTLDMESPKGLGVQGKSLFVCDNGIKVYNISNPRSPKFKKKISIPAYDVIPIDSLLLVATEEGLFEYKINENEELLFVSTLLTSNQNTK